MNLFVRVAEFALDVTLLVDGMDSVLLNPAKSSKKKKKKHLIKIKKI
jgi:hypothetical protein